MLTYDGLNITKNYSSLTHLFNIHELQTTKRYLFEFDYRLEISTQEPTTIARVAFLGPNNLDDYMIDLLDKDPGTYATQGVNKHVYDYTIVANGDGWNHVRLTFTPDYDFKARVNSLRFLIDAKFDDNNKLFLSNIKIVEHSNVPYNAITPAIVVKDNKAVVWISLTAGTLVIASAGVATPLILKKKKRRLLNEK